MGLFVSFSCDTFPLHTLCACSRKQTLVILYHLC